MKKFLKRAGEQRIRYLAEHFPVIMLTGARQIGKTTLLKNMYTLNNKKINYITLDYPNIRELAQKDPELFLQQYKAPLIIDEIQYAPELFPYIKIRVDEDNTAGQYFLTGSQMFQMMKNVSESLAGRVGIMPLYSFNMAEIMQEERPAFLPKQINEPLYNYDISQIFERIYRGSMPKMICDTTLETEAFYSAYLQTYIERDIRSLIEIKNEQKFLKFIACLAARTAQELNLSDIAKDVSIDSKTADSWLSLLVSSGLVYLLHPYSGNTIKRIVKRPKLYFMDTGLVCYLTLWNNPRALELSAMAGPLFETFVISEIIKSYANAGKDSRQYLSYYRDNNKNEIDLLILENGKIHPIEIKKKSNPDKDDIKNFRVLDSFDVEIGSGAVICLSPMIMPLDNKNKILPIACI